MPALNRTWVARVLFLLSCSTAMAAADEPQPIDLVVHSGYALRVALDRRVTVKEAGQGVTGTLLESVYAYDRVVMPAGATVLGHIQRIDNPKKVQRVRSWLSGDLSPKRLVTVDFDRIRLADGSEFPLRTEVSNSAERVSLKVASGDESNAEPGRRGVTGRAKDDATQRARQMKENATRRAREALATIRGPDKVERLKAIAIQRLPYHPQFLPKGSVYTLTMIDPVTFGTAVPVARAAAGGRPEPDSVLSARLVTALDSAKTPRGTAVKAVVTEPIFSGDHDLIVPVGSELTGEVTFAKAARRFHRNGQLRFLIESVQLPESDITPLLASLSSIQVDDDAPVEVDEEGGAKATESKKRFIPPALAALALGASLHREPRRIDNDADDSLSPPPGGNPVTHGVSGFFGFGVLGAAVSQVSHPVGLAISAVGVGRTVYSTVFGKGRDVVFPAATPIQVQLAPGPEPRPTPR